MPIPKILRSEYATVLNDITNPYPMYGGRLDPQDETLVKRGGLALSYKIYEELLTDTHCSAVMQKRISAVVGREWEVVPASKRAIDKKAADMVKAHLEALDSRGIVTDKNETILDTGSGFDQVSADQLWSIFYGFSVNEIVWDQDGKEIFPSKIPRRDIRRFSFRTMESGQFALRLMTPSSRWEGEALPPRKFIVQRFNGGGLSEDPYGLGIASKLWYPVFFKRQTGQFWLIFADKWASPTAVAKYAKGTSDEQKDTLLQMLQAIATDAGIVIPDTVAIEFLEAQRTGTVNCYKDLIDFCNNEISKAVLGETGTTDQSSGGGSRARDQIGNEVRIEIAKFDADMLSLTLNRSLVRWIVDFNLPGAKPPKVWRKFPELDNKIDRQAEAGIIQTLVTAGFTPKRDWVAERMEVELEEQEPGMDQGQGVDVTGEGIPDDADTPPDLGALLSGDAGAIPADGAAPIDPAQQQPTEDINGDGVIDESDIPPDLSGVGQTQDQVPTEDINGDGVIDESDIPPDLTGVGEAPSTDEEDETDTPPDLGFAERKKSKKRKQAKFRKIMHEFKSGKLKSSSGDPVKSRKQAIAIALSVTQNYAEGDLTTIDQLVAIAEQELKPEVEKWIKQIARWAKPLPQDVAIDRITEVLEQIDKSTAIDDLTTLLIESEYLGRSDAADQLGQSEPGQLEQQIEDEYSELAIVVIALLLANLAKDLMTAWESGNTDTIAAATNKGWAGENAFRIALIASQNLFSAWRSGHWAVQSTNLTHPYLMWVHDEPMQPRPQHVALDRLVLPVSHPFWKYCYPGCDWGCRCVAVPLTEADLKRRKLQVGTPPTDTTEMRDVVTGEMARIPKVGGIPIASPAFVYSRDTTPKRRAEVILRSGYEGLPDVIRYYLARAI